MEPVISTNYKGKIPGSINCKNLKWKITIFDKEKNEFKEGKFTTTLSSELCISTGLIRR